ncbi:hypothetical protein DFJ73DRAFT_955849 [Zopfochytrium polystomum]|nr:hypothetical protein DFJ73DRAFT_955849 [Zopfochytrium polystomum]
MTDPAAVVAPFPRGGAPASAAALSQLEWREAAEQARKDARKQAMGVGRQPQEEPALFDEHTPDKDATRPQKRPRAGDPDSEKVATETATRVKAIAKKARVDEDEEVIRMPHRAIPIPRLTFKVKPLAIVVTMARIGRVDAGAGPSFLFRTPAIRSDRWRRGPADRKRPRTLLLRWWGASGGWLEQRACSVQIRGCGRGEERGHCQLTGHDRGGYGPHRTTAVDASSETLLRHAQIRDGMQILGVVVEINELDVVLSLPHQLMGYLSITEISKHVTAMVERVAEGDQRGENEGSEDMAVDGTDKELPALKDFFVVGQFLQCSVLSSEAADAARPGGRRRIELSIRPELINQGLGRDSLAANMILSASVTSVEDHGYLLDFGMDQLTGFLHQKQAKAYADAILAGKPLKVGQPIVCKILKVDAAKRVVPVTADPADIRNSPISSSNKSLALESIRPGSLYSCKIRNVSHDGLVVAVLGIFDATVDVFHILDAFKGEERALSELFKAGQKVEARVLHVDHNDKRIALTMREAFLSWSFSNPFDYTRIGEIWEDAIVLRTDEHGIVLKQQSSGTIGYVHNTRLSDKESESIDYRKKHAVGSIHRARIVAPDLCDGFWLLSTKRSVLSAPFLRAESVPVGSTVKGTIFSVHSAGLVVSLSEQVRAFVPRSHIREIAPTGDISRQFKIGDAVKARVLHSDPGSKKLLLTMKKPMVASTMPIISSYDSANVGVVSEGYISGVRDFGCIVTFYNGVRALVPVPELSERHLVDPTEHFQLGQVVKCKIMSVYPEGRKMKGSFKRVVNPSMQEAINLANVEIGSVVEGRILSLGPDSALLELQPSLTRALLSKENLTDHLSVAAQLFSTLQEGQVLYDLLVLQIDERRGLVHVTAKPLLVRHRQLVRAGAASDLETGEDVPCIITGWNDTKWYVLFDDGRVGFSTIDDPRERSGKGLVKPYERGQTVIARVKRTEGSSGSIEVSLKDAQETSFVVGTVSYPVFIFQTYLSDHDRIQLHQHGPSTSLSGKPWASLFRLGSVVSGKVTTSVKGGFTLEVLCDGVKATGHVSNADVVAEAPDCKVGDTLTCRILDGDFGAKSLELKVVRQSEKGKKQKENRERLENARTSKAAMAGTVLLVKPLYLVVSLDELDSELVYVPLRSSIGRSGAKSIRLTDYRVGMPVKVQVDVVSLKKPTETFLSQRNLGFLLKDAPKVAEVKGKAKDKRAIIAAIDPSVSTMNDLSIGRTIKGTIKAIAATELVVALGANLTGTVHITELVSMPSELADPNSPFSGYKTGQTKEFKIIGIGFRSSGEHLPISQSHIVPTAKQALITLTLRPVDIKLPSGELATPASDRDQIVGDVEMGKVYTGFVHKVWPDHAWVMIGRNLRGRVSLAEMSLNNAQVLKNPRQEIRRFSCVRVTPVGIDTIQGWLDLSIRGAQILDGLASGENKPHLPLGFPLTIENLCPGSRVIVSVNEVKRNRGLVVDVTENIKGFVRLADISKDLPERPEAAFAPKAFVLCEVLKFDSKLSRLDLSIRAAQESAPKVEEDKIYTGYVSNVSYAGVFVDLGWHTSARVRIAELADEFIKDWKAGFPVGKRVVGKIISATQGRIEMSLKRTAIDPNYTFTPVRKIPKREQGIKLEDVKTGSVVKGSIKALAAFGVFIQIDGSRVSGLCHMNDLTDDKSADLATLYKVGDPVLAKILKVSLEKQRVSFGLKPSLFSQSDLKLIAAPESNKSTEAMEEDISEDEGVELDLAAPPSGPVPIQAVAPLTLEGFQWDDDEFTSGHGRGRVGGTADDSDSDGDDDDDDAAANGTTSGGADAAAKKLSRRAKKREKREAEERIAQQERSLLTQQTPDSAEAFDRLLMGSPNSSFLWIKFMAFHLQMAEVGKAREVAERAVKTIAFRETQERLNVWVALLNLENAFGDRTSLLRAFERATTYNEPKAVFIQMAVIYERSSKFEELDALYKTMTRRFRESCKVWAGNGLSLLKRGKVDKARKILQRSLLSLPKRKHLKIVSKFAQMEFKYGEPERGRTLFEGILTNHPKRIDMWSIYLDMEIRTADVEKTRRLFERVITLKMSSKKMKFFFKKYLMFEKKHGTEMGVEHTFGLDRRLVAFFAEIQLAK